MRITLRINNREFALEITSKHNEMLRQVDKYTDGTIHISTDGEGAKAYTIKSVADDISTPADTVRLIFGDGSREIFHDSEPSPGIPIPDTDPLTKPYVIDNLVAESKLCPCIHYTGLATPGACTECTEAGRHSGGCDVANCVDGHIVPVCYCLMPGFVKCFNCEISIDHSPVCTNCT